MTVFLPLEATVPFPSSPPFLTLSADSKAQVSKVIKAILRAKRIVVICGAGISVQAGIPDFRSPEGLFQTLKRDNPKDVLSSGKDLFDASVFKSEHTTSLFCQMIARLSVLSKAAEPTPFHSLLHSLDRRGKLLRVYTQNIDALEVKSGLTFGVPPLEVKRTKSRTKDRPPALDIDDTCLGTTSEDPSSSRLSSPSRETPRCIPLHGTLQTVHCQICNHSYPLEDYLPSFVSGSPPECPECTSLETTRQLVGKRARGIGKLRPSVVLYNEAHKDGEGVGEAVRKDLLGSKGRSGADLLLVVGTSLKVPGTKRMVREFAKAVHSRGQTNKDTATSSGSSPQPDEETACKAIYLNLEFPLPSREWEGVFDVWLQGDAQTFAAALQEEIAKEARVKELAEERKKRREMDDAAPDGLSPPKKRMASSNPSTPKRKKMTYPLTPPRNDEPPTPARNLQRSSKSLSTTLIPIIPILTPVKKNRHFGVGQAPPTPDKSPPRSSHPSVALLTHDSDMYQHPHPFLTPLHDQMHFSATARWVESFVRTQ